jgi:hypothetical protein
MARQIADPADRLSKEFIEALDERLCNLADAKEVQVGDFDSRYAAVCDLVVQLLWPEHYGTGPDDPNMHTSAPARQIARLFFIAAGIEPDLP